MLQLAEHLPAKPGGGLSHGVGERKKESKKTVLKPVFWFRQQGNGAEIALVHGREQIWR